MSDIDPDLTPEAWDIALIGSTITPGICRITQGGRPLKWDKKAGFGTAGTTTKLTGIEVQGFTMTVYFYEGAFGKAAAEQRTDWETNVLPLLKQAESGKDAIEFYHPAVSEPPMNVRAVVPENVGMYEQDGDGLWSVAVKFIEYGKPKPAVGAPKGASGFKAGEVKVADENETRIAELTQQLKDLAS